MIRLMTTVLPALCLGATLTGLGLERNLNPIASVFGAGLLTILPILGLKTLLPAQPWALPVSSWTLSLLLLASLPLYFPGQRVQATSKGVTQLTFFLGDHASLALGEAGGELMKWVGGETEKRYRPPLSSKTVAEPKPIEPLGQSRALIAIETPQVASTSEPIILRYDGDDRSLRIHLDVDGPTFSELYTVILDTGATYSTLSAEALENIGVHIAPDAPWVELQTAGGLIEAPLALVDAIWLGEFPVEWVTVAICEACSHPPVEGLLGLNVLQRFRVSIDHEDQEIELHPRPNDSNRRLDIGHWLKITGRITRSSDGNVELELRGRNRARQAIRSAVININCTGSGFAVELGEIPANGDAYTRIDLPQDTDCEKHTLSLSRAHWVEERFENFEIDHE